MNEIKTDLFPEVLRAGKKKEKQEEILQDQGKTVRAENKMENKSRKS